MKGGDAPGAENRNSRKKAQKAQKEDQEKISRKGAKMKRVKGERFSDCTS